MLRPEMLWVVLVLAGVSAMVVAMSSGEQHEAGESLTARASVIGRSLRAGTARAASTTGRLLQRLWTRSIVVAQRMIGAIAAWREHRRMRDAYESSMRFARASVRAPARRRRERDVGWRTRMTALLELILFVTVISALFAGAVAAAVVRVGHFGH